MFWVFFTALTVGAATLLGTAAGLLFRCVQECTRRILISSAAGIMLHSAMFGLIQPATELAHACPLPLLLVGLLLGFLFLSGIRRLSPYLLGSMQSEKKTASLLFLLAMGIHHIPEGIAAGVSFGTGSAEDIITVAGGITLQNIPEGLLLVAPLIALGIRPLRILLIGLGISILEAFGVFLGYFASAVSASFLPLSLGFAAGTMLYIMFTDMIPDACPPEPSEKPVYAALFGFGLMCVVDFLL